MRQCYLDLLSHCRVVPGLSRQAIGLRAFLWTTRNPSCKRKNLFFPPLSLAFLLSMQSNGQARILFADSFLPRSVAIDWISTRSYLARLQDRCGKPKSFTMAPTIYPRLPSSMKGIRHKAEVWLSRESKQARTPFRSASFLMSHHGAKRLAKRKRERGERKGEREKWRTFWSSNF